MGDRARERQPSRTMPRDRALNFRLGLKSDRPPSGRAVEGKKREGIAGNWLYLNAMGHNRYFLQGFLTVLDDHSEKPFGEISDCKAPSVKMEPDFAFYVLWPPELCEMTADGEFIQIQE